MLLKRYRQKTLDATLREVQSELGNDALIVETRRTPAGYEILAAPHEDRAALKRAHATARLRNKDGKAQPSLLPRATSDRWRPGFRDLAMHALEHGWSARVINAVEKALAGTQVHLERPGDPAVPTIARRILTALVRTRSLEAPDLRVLAFVGPTGVGKTTTLAKFAARAIRDRGERVAIVTLDTYRIAAVEQLRAFADMLDAPFEVAFTPDDLRRVVAKRMDSTNDPVDRVLIDTTGRSPRDTSALHDLATVLGKVRAETALCIPAYARFRDCHRIIESWSSSRRPAAVVLTKDDETDAHGEALSALVEDGIPISHLTDGQRVPEDIDDANAARIALRTFPDQDESRGKTRETQSTAPQTAPVA